MATTERARRIKELRRELRDLEAQERGLPTPAQIRAMSDEEFEELERNWPALRDAAREGGAGAHEPGAAGAGEYVFDPSGNLRRGISQSEDPDVIRARRKGLEPGS